MGYFDDLKKSNHKQCATKSPSGPCPDPAFYQVESTDRPTSLFCVRCTSAVLFHGTTYGRSLQIRRI